ncbi:hypothetical protein LCGC14_1337570, partial [marine sediment metagenome]
MSQQRKELVGTGMRAEKVRTYNYPQNRVTDHQVNLTLKKLDHVIEGDLDVKGTTTTRDVDQVNAYNAYFDNLDVGNADTDLHNIKGEWKHTSTGGGSTAFAVDGDTGRVGIGGAYDGTSSLKVTGDSLFVGSLLPSGTRNVGLTGNRWSTVFAESVRANSALYAGPGDEFTANVNLARFTDIPIQFNASGAGANEAHWALEIVSGANETLTFSTKTSTWTAGAAFLEVKRTVDSSVIELLTLTATELDIAGNLRPNDDTRELGGASNKWKKLYLSNIDDEGVATDLIPATDTLDLGKIGYPWQKLYLSTSAGHGIAGGLMPVSNGTQSIGSYSTATETGYVWNQVVCQTGIFAHTTPKLTLFRSDLGADRGGWGFQVDALDDLIIGPIKDDGTNTNWAFLITRGASGVAIDSISIGSDLIPAYSTFGIGTAAIKWADAFFTGTIEGGQLRATDDTGGTASTVTFTNVTTGLGAGNIRSVKGSTVGSNEGWLKIYIEGVTKHLPYYGSA